MKKLFLLIETLTINVIMTGCDNKEYILPEPLKQLNENCEIKLTEKMVDVWSYESLINSHPKQEYIIIFTKRSCEHCHEYIKNLEQALVEVREPIRKVALFEAEGLSDEQKTKFSKFSVSTMFLQQ